METEFLNFRDEERFTAYDSFDYQETNGILEWSSITGIKNEYSYTTQSSRDSMDDSGAYWGDEERELNGDIAVIPVSGRLDHVFPHLSTSPDCKEDFQKMLSDWHEHIGALEGSDTEDHMSIVTNHQDDLSMSHIDYGPTPKIHNSSPYRQLNLDTNVLSLPKKKKTESCNDDTTKFEPDSFHSPFSIEDSHLDQSLSEVELNLGHDALKIDIESIVKVEDEILMKTEPIDDNEVCSFDKDLKNFDLVTAVVKDEIDLNLSIENDKNQIYNSPEFDMSPKDSFDLTSYINGDEDKCILKDKKANVSMADMFNSNMVEDICSEIKQFEKKSTNVSDIKSKNKTNKNKTKSKKNVKKLTSERSPLKVDVEDDCIDVETVSPTGIHPVIEAGDLTTLLEQFEATEAVNTTSKQVKTPNVCSQVTKDLCKSDSKKLASDKMLCVSQKNMCKRYKKLARFDDNESVTKDVLERIRASGKKKSITVIPAMPAKKSMKSIRSQDNEVSNKILWSTAGYSSPGEKSIQLDHNYCTLSPTKSPLKVANSVTGNSDAQNMESVTEYYKVLKKPDVIGRGIGSKGIRCADTPDPSSDPKNEIGVSAIETNTENRSLKTVIVSKKHINDTAIRIQNRNEIIIRKQISPNKIVKVSPTTPTKLKIMPQSRTILTQGTLLKNGSRIQQSLLTVNQKSVLMKNAATSHQQSLLRSNVASFKNVDGKVMVSVLKTNNKNMVQNGNKIIVNTVVDTTTSKDKCVRNIITDETRNCTKKRKLNLEEYKKRREIGRTAHSCNTSRTNSPIGFVPSGNSSPMVHHGSFSLPVTAVGSPISQPGTPVYETIEPIKKIEPKKLSPEEKLLKMAADILTTPAKSSTSPDVKYTIEPFTEPKPEAEQSTEILKLPTKEEPVTETICIPPKPVNEDFEMLTIVSIGVNTTESYFSENKFDSTEPEKSKINANVPTISFKIKKNEVLTKNKFFDSRCNENCESMLSENKSANIISADKNLQDTKSGTNKTLLNCKQSGTVDTEKLTEIIAPILQSATTKINSNSLISNITATILKKIPENIHAAKTVGVTQKAMKQQDNNLKIKSEVSQMPPEHGEDKTVIILDKKRPKPVTCDIEIQTDFIIDEVLEDDKKKMEKTEVKVLNNDRKCRQYRSRRVSSSSSSSNVSNRSLRISRKNFRSSSVTRSRRRSHHTSSTRSSHRRSVSSLGSSRWSRSSQSRSRSRSRSYSRSYSRSSYSSMSSRSPSPSSTRRRRLDSRRSSSSRYSRTRRRSRSNYRNYRHSRSPFNRGPRGRNGRSWESVEREKLRQVEERRVIYVGRLEPGTTKADLRRLFQKFGPVIEVSVHFRDQGDNYGFVTFSYQDDAYEAIEQGTNDPDLVHYDISFGGRRAFCKTRYSDLDNSDAIEMNGYRPMQEDSSFDVLLKEAQAKLRKRKA